MSARELFRVGEIVLVKPEWLERGEDAATEYKVVIADESERGSLHIQAIVPVEGLPLGNPINLVHAESVMRKPASVTEEGLCAELEAWATAQGLPARSADEYDEDETTEEQRAWLFDFGERWDAFFSERVRLEMEKRAAAAVADQELIALRVAADLQRKQLGQITPELLAAIEESKARTAVAEGAPA